LPTIGQQGNRKKKNTETQKQGNRETGQQICPSDWLPATGQQGNNHDGYTRVPGVCSSGLSALFTRSSSRPCCHSINQSDTLID
jgi:hypothetical protein